MKWFGRFPVAELTIHLIRTSHGGTGLVTRLSHKLAVTVPWKCLRKQWVLSAKRSGSAFRLCSDS